MQQCFMYALCHLSLVVHRIFDSCIQYKDVNFMFHINVFKIECKLQIVTKLWMLLSVLCNVSQMYRLWKHLACGFPIRAPPGYIMRRGATYV